MTSALIRWGKFEHRHTGKHHMMMEAEVGVICLQAKDHQGLPEARKSQGRILLWNFEQTWFGWYLGFGLGAFWNVSKYITVALSHPFCGTFLKCSLRKLTYILSLIWTTLIFYLYLLQVYLFKDQIKNYPRSSVHSKHSNQLKNQVPLRIYMSSCILYVFSILIRK